MRWGIVLVVGMGGCAVSGGGPVDPSRDSGEVEPDPNVDPRSPCDLSRSRDELAALEIPAAKATFDACLAVDPSNANAKFGAAITGLLTADDWPSVVEARELCGQPDNVRAMMWGKDGFFRVWSRQAGHAGSLTVTTVKGSEPAAFVPNEGHITASTYDQDDTGCGSCSTASLRAELRDKATSSRLQINVSASGDPTGLTFDVMSDADDGDRAGASLSFACDDASEWSCVYARRLSGTVRVDTWSVDPGGRNVWTYDLQFGHDDDWSTKWDQALGKYVPVCTGACRQIRLQGTVDDAVDDDVSKLLEGISFSEWENPCDTETCAGFEAALWVDANCEVENFGQVHRVLDDLSGVFEDLARLAREAGASPDFSFELPLDNLWFASADSVTLNQADALGLAAGLEGAAMGLRLGWNYRVVDPAATPASLVSTGLTDITCDYEEVYNPVTEDYDYVYSWDGETGRGTKLRDLYDQLQAHAFTLRPGGNLEGSRLAFGRMLADVRAAVMSSPTVAGMLDPKQAERDGYLATVVSDLDVAIASLGQDAPLGLATNPATRLSLGSLFTSPPSRASIEAEVGEPLWTLTTEQATCGGLPTRTRERFAIDGLADWGVDGLGTIEFPGYTTPQGDFRFYKDAKGDDLPKPGMVEDFEKVEAQGNRDLPLFLNEDMIDRLIPAR